MHLAVFTAEFPGRINTFFSYATGDDFPNGIPPEESAT